MKKLFFISLGIFLVTLLFLGVYNFAFKKSGNNPVADQEKKDAAKQETERTFLEKLKSAPVEAVTATPAFGAATLDGKFLAYFYGGKLRKVSLGGGAEEVLVENLPGKLLRAVWSPNRESVLALFETEGKERWYLVRITEKSATPLKDGLSSPSWSNLGEKIFYFYTDPVTKKTGLNTAKSDGSEWKEIGSAPFGDPRIGTIPSSVSVSFWNRPSAFDETTLYTIPITGGTSKKIFSGKYGADFLWSPSGDKVLISALSDKGGSDIRLGIANQDGGEFHTLQAPTFVSKAVWSKDGKTLYYALPLSLPSDAALPNDYLDRPIHTSDSFWRMDTETGASERIIDPTDIGGSFDSINPFLDQEEQYFFFTNRVDNRLYRIRL